MFVKTKGNITAVTKNFQPLKCRICGKQTKSFIWMDFTLAGVRRIGAICLTDAKQFTTYDFPTTERKTRKAKNGKAKLATKPETNSK
jgi:hypothetical protein